MHTFSPGDNQEPPFPNEDEYLFGWDPTPGVVSVWANREGQAIIWQRLGDHIISSRERFRPWLFATSLQDAAQLGPQLIRSFESPGDISTVTYLELNGPPESYHYLISASNGRFLERALVDGASRRLGRQINSINELRGEYYRVGPVEQFLMQSGKVYFRGLSYNDLHRLQFDLETTALDPHRGRIFRVAVRDNRRLATIIEAPTPEDEMRLISNLCALIRERDPDVIENHNLFGFDVPFLEHRASVVGVPLILGREGGPRHLERRYALDDVMEVDELSQRLLGAPFALASMAPRRYERLASAGPAMGILEPMLVRAYLHNRAALPCQSMSQYSNHGMHEGGAVHLLAEGVAEHVVKADVASLYPSLMRTFQIGPACDHLGVLLTILGRLTDLRLSLKAAAKQAIPESLEANSLEATQAAMKILINAAYGYSRIASGYSTGI